MKTSVQLVTLWGNQAPAHSITAILITEDQRTIVTGSQEGQICLWDLSSSDLKISSKQMLFGHTASVTCLAKARDFEKHPYVVSATENGEMCVWNITCGQCVESTRLPFQHTAICYYHSSFRMTGEGWLLCCGQYNDILIIDAKALSVLHTLTSSQSSDWISCMCLVHSPRIQEDSLIAVSATGTLKVWDLSSSVSRIRERQDIHERESKSLDCAPCRTVRFCTFTERLLLVVFSSCWKIYDYCDFSLLWTEFSPSGQSFAGGEVLAAHRLIIWMEDGRGFIYQLLNSGLSRSIQPCNGRPLKETLHPQLLCSTDVGDEKSFSYIMGFINERKEPFYKILYCGAASGRITLWHIPDVPVSTLDGSPKEIPIATSWALQNSFDSCSPAAEGIIDHLCGAENGMGSVAITSSIYIPSLDKLVCGFADGRIFILLALQAAKARLMGKGSLLKDSQDTQPHRILSHHSTSVTSLLYLHGRSARFDPSWLMSGSQDSSVVWWDIFTGELLHCFSLQAGPVTNLLLSSENYRFRGHRIVCCLCSNDHAVVLLHIQERACLMQARKHLSPVKRLQWHAVENLLVVGCEDDSVYVWDIETGSLERHETGEVAQAILACCEDSVMAAADSLSAVFEEDPPKQKNLDGQSSNSYKIGTLSYSSLAHREKSSHHQLPTACHTQWPFTILPVKTERQNIHFYVLLFDLEKLAELLHSAQLKGLKSSSSFHSYDALKRAKSTADKRMLMLKRNRTSGSLFPLDGQVKVAAEEQTFGESNAVGSLEQSGGIKRHKKPKSSKKVRRQPSGKVNVNVVMDAAKLLLSCLLPWGVDGELDDLCVQYLDILRLLYPVSLGLMSRNNHLSLTLPGWRNASSPGAEQQQEANHLFSRKVLDLCHRYISVAQEQTGRTNGHTKSIRTTERSLTLSYLLRRIYLVQRIFGRPLEKTSRQKLESARNKWRPTSSLGTTSSYEESTKYTLGFPVHEPENNSLVKLISSWRDQSIEMTEAIQAALLAEVRQGLRNRRKTFSNGHGQGSAKVEEQRTEEPEIIKIHPLLAATNCDNCTTPADLQEGKDMAERQVLEESENPDEKKSHPWMFKVCSCKLC
ncbi:WD repeat-containing protein 72 isoform X3 [Zootoca vivipara]|uniref:WD repeat-containing protein 72 isoform X3 n=1 Tax=Zootoca vivipara TaxID=8524 RepID=UPI00293BD474|nr:WD repeat-containing protein 72 isoform X3 [Zootoca vivipara]